MRAVKENLYEKFTEDSDPIKDLGIGIFSEHNFKSEKQLHEFLFNALPAICKTIGIPDDIVFRKEQHAGAFRFKYYHAFADYCKKYIKLNGNKVDFEESGQLVRLWNRLLKMGYPKIHLDSNPDLGHQILIEKFTADSDPIRDLGIGGINFEQIALKTARTGDKGLRIWLDYLESLKGKTIIGVFAKSDKKVKTFEISHYHSYKKGSRLVFSDTNYNFHQILKRQNYIIK